MTKIVDYFQYYDPIDKEKLELRIAILKDHVDEFVISEANKTHSGIPVEYKLRETIKQLGITSDKIKIIEVDIPDNDQLELLDVDYYNCYQGNDANINAVRARARDRLTKDSISSIIDEFDSDTAFIVSDSDEIINPDFLLFYVNTVKVNADKLIKVPLIQLEGRANLRVHDKNTGDPFLWDRSMFVCMKSHFQQATTTNMRSNVYNPFPIVHIYNENGFIQDAGWHFSWMGDSKYRNIKRISFAHYDDTFDHLIGNSYKNNDMLSFMNTEPCEGSISCSGDVNTVLKLYPEDKLPKELLQLPRVKKVFLPNKRMIVDCFSYFNERELLELRIKMLDDYVDKFVICESNYTFSGIPKPFVCKKTLEELNLMSDKIEVIEIDLTHLEEIDNPWIREETQVNSATPHLLTYPEDTVFIITDCDEIMDPAKIYEYADFVSNNKDKLVKIPMYLIYGRADMEVFHINGERASWDFKPFMCTTDHLKTTYIRTLRDNFYLNYPITHIKHNGVVENAGWHFGWMGDSDRKIIKLQSYSHHNDILPTSKLPGVNTPETVEYLKNYTAVDGGLDPLARTDCVLKKMSWDLLPQKIFELPHIKDFLLP